MRGHNVCFYAELTQIIPKYQQILLLSRALSSIHEIFMVPVHLFCVSAIFGDICQSIQGQLCLRSLADISVSYVMLPLPERQYNLCEV